MEPGGQNETRYWVKQYITTTERNSLVPGKNLTCRLKRGTWVAPDREELAVFVSHSVNYLSRFPLCMVCMQLTGPMGAVAETGSLGNTVFTSAGFIPAPTFAHT